MADTGTSRRSNERGRALAAAIAQIVRPGQGGIDLLDVDKSGGEEA